MNNNHFSPRILLLAIATLSTIALRAQEAKQVYGRSVVVWTDDMTRGQVRQEGIKQARLKAIKDSFNEIITSQTTMQEGIVDGEEYTSYSEDINILQRAEWVEDTRQPEFSDSISGETQFLITEVWGLAREKKDSGIGLKWKILCGGTDSSFENNIFNNGQRLYIKFLSPLNGYLAIYLLDAKQAYCLLPYKNQAEGRYRIVGGKEYCLFDKSSDPQAFHYTMTTKAPKENNEIVVVFSPNRFTKCAEKRGSTLHTNHVSRREFEDWLLQLRRNDTEMVVDRSKHVVIKNNQIK